MSSAHSPIYTQRVPIHDLQPNQFIALAVDACRELGWPVKHATENELLAATDFDDWAEKISIHITDGVALLESKSYGDGTTDYSLNEKHITALISIIEQKKTTTPIDDVVQKSDAYTAVFMEPKPKATTKEKFADFFSLFRPREGYFVTPLLVDINILVFIIMVATGVGFVQPQSADLIAWGANFRPITLTGQWWRLLTCCFLHIGILHLLMNMYALVYIGLLLEPYLGRTKFIAAYLLTGIASSLTSLCWHDLTVSAGASGAIFGMYGVFLALLTTNHIEKTQRKALLSSMMFFVGYNLLYGMKDGIDNAAHIGGLLSGMIAGYALLPSLKPGAEKKGYAAIALLTLLTIAATVIVFKKTPNDFAIYEKNIKEFNVIEQKALRMYSFPKSTGTQAYMAEIRDSGLYYWHKNLQLMKSTDSLNLPEAIHERNRTIITYCELRIKSYEFIYKGLEENTDKYADSVAYYDTKLDEILK